MLSGMVIFRFRGPPAKSLLNRQDTVDFWTSEHPLAQPVSYCEHRLPKCHGLLAGPFSLPQRKPVKWGKLDMKFVQETH